DVERSHVAEVEARGRRRMQAFMRTAQRLEHGHARGAEAGIGQQAGERSRPLAVRSQRKDARAWLQMWTDEIERAAMERERGRLRQRPAQTCGGKAEGRKRRHRHRLAGVDMPQQDRADAVNEWIARCEHAYLPSALRQHLLDRALERASPRPRDAADERGGKNKMSLAAKHHLCRLDKASSDRRQSVDAV